MNELVKKLSAKEYTVTVNRPDTSAKALEERIRLNLVHVLFEETGTEVGIRLDQHACDLRHGDFMKGTGKIHLQGVLTLNATKVRCMVDVDLETMKGTGRLQPSTEEAYHAVAAQHV